MMGSAMPNLINFPQERPIFVREYASGSYGVGPYFLAKALVELPFEFLRSILVMVLVYWTEAYQGNFMMLVLCCFMIQICASSMAILIGSTVKDV